MPEQVNEQGAVPREVARAFEPERRVSGFERLGSGHIHETLRARYDDGDDIVLQQLNEHVFPDLEAVMHNVVAVTSHLRERVESGETRSVLEPLRSASGEALVRDSQGRAWRAYRFVDRTRVYDVLPTHALAESAARAFGSFAASLVDLDPGSLAIALPGFHDLEGRLRQLEVAVAHDGADRKAAVTAEIEGIGQIGTTLVEALESAGLEDLPERIVHNDCKVNNLLFDEQTDEPICVVDLDTVMPGTLLVDFGELVRTGTCSAAEDERDLSMIDFDGERFDALARGYVAGLSNSATASELDALWLGGPWMAIENAVRFLTDHLDGDVYYPARRADHNLERARAQHHLAEQLWEARDALRGGVERARSASGSTRS